MTNIPMPEQNPALPEPGEMLLFRESFNPNPYLMEVTKGKKYLEVGRRIQWINHDAPMPDYDTFEILPELLKYLEYPSASGKTVREAVFKCEVRLYKDGRLIKRAIGHGTETSTDFAAFWEKAETKAIGRALAAAGFGTQFAVDDFDEGTKPSPIDGTPGPALSDTPVKPVRSAPAPRAATPSAVKPGDPTVTAPIAVHTSTPAPAPARPAPAAAPAPAPAPAPAAAPAVTPGFDRNAAMAWLQSVASQPAVSQVLGGTVAKYLGSLQPADQRVSNLSDEQLCEAFEQSKRVAA